MAEFEDHYDGNEDEREALDDKDGFMHPCVAIGIGVSAGTFLGGAWALDELSERSHEGAVEQIERVEMGVADEKNDDWFLRDLHNRLFNQLMPGRLIEPGKTPPNEDADAHMNEVLFRNDYDQRLENNEFSSLLPVESSDEHTPEYLSGLADAIAQQRIAIGDTLNGASAEIEAIQEAAFEPSAENYQQLGGAAIVAGIIGVVIFRRVQQSDRLGNPLTGAQRAAIELRNWSAYKIDMIRMKREARGVDLGDIDAGYAGLLSDGGEDKKES